MNATSAKRWERYLTGFFLLLPIVALAWACLAWLIHGLDFPLYDDWRAYANGAYGSLDAGYLFTPTNDTLSPVGLALEALAARYLHGNSVAYQFVTLLLVGGGLLYFQWRLLAATLEDRLPAAACFSLTVLMLQPGGYWGRENLAYHQALPLLALLAALYMTLIARGPRRWRMAAVFVLGLASGLTYSSGAVSVLVAGCVLLAATWRMPAACAGSSRLPSIAFLVAGASGTAIQTYAVTVLQGDRVHNETFPVAWPITADFWSFLLGKIGRALMLPPELPVFSVIIVAGIVVLSFVLAFRCFRRPDSGKAPGNAAALSNLEVIYLVLLAVVCAYLALVAFGRARLRPPEMTAWQEIFSLGFTRFHFFWVTLLWPWLTAMLVARHKHDGSGRRALSVLPILAILLWSIFRGVFLHGEYFKQEADRRLATVACLRDQIPAGGPIRCEEFVACNLPDLRAGIELARRQGASFMRYLPPSAPPRPTGAE